MARHSPKNDFEFFSRFFYAYTFEYVRGTGIGIPVRSLLPGRLGIMRISYLVVLLRSLSLGRTVSFPHSRTVCLSVSLSRHHLCPYVISPLPFSLLPLHLLLLLLLQFLFVTLYSTAHHEFMHTLGECLNRRKI